jgi:two-component system, response regulator
MNNSIEKRPEVLVIEDNAVDAMFIKRTLKNSKITDCITTVNDGTAALEYLLDEGSNGLGRITNLPQLILLDLKMPKMDGFEFLHQLRSYQKFKDIPVIIFTGSSDEHDKKMALNLGANDYYAKPISIPAFVAIIEEIGKFWLQKDIIDKPR